MDWLEEQCLIAVRTEKNVKKKYSGTHSTVIDYVVGAVLHEEAKEGRCARTTY
jgi:hypothetical protein